MINIYLAKQGMLAHYAIIRNIDKAHEDNARDISIMFTNGLISSEVAADLRLYNDDLYTLYRGLK